MAWNIVKIRYTQGDYCTQPGGIILRSRVVGPADGAEYAVHNFTRFPGSKEPRDFFWGNYITDDLDKAREAFDKKVETALRYDRGGALIPLHALDDKIEEERRERPTASQISIQLGIDLEDAEKVLETSCVTKEEFAADPDAGWQRLRGAAEELCQHQFEPAVDDDGELIEPAHDICIHCGERRD